MPGRSRFRPAPPADRRQAGRQLKQKDTRDVRVSVYLPTYLPCLLQGTLGEER